MAKIEYQSYVDSWEALYPDDPEKQETMRFRSRLLSQIREIGGQNNLKIEELQMRLDDGDVKTMELLKEMFGSDEQVEKAGYVPLPEGITGDEIKELQNPKMNRHDRRAAIARLRRQKKRPISGYFQTKPKKD